jgi:hypothetical protein
MESMKQTGILASAMQKAQIMGVYVSMLMELFESLRVSKAKYLLSDLGKKKLKSDLAGYFEIQIDPWATQKANLERFWLTVFNYQINWDDFVLPEYSDRYPHLNIIPTGFTAEQIFAGITQCTKFTFKKRTKYYSDIDKALRDAKAIQSRPTGNYAFADGGTDEPDQEHLNKSYDESINAGLMFMGPVEYLLSCAFKEFMTGKPYDVKGVTRLSVLDSDGDAMRGFWHDDCGSYLGWRDRDHRYPDCGPRVVVFTT